MLGINGGSRVIICVYEGGGERARSLVLSAVCVG